MRPPVLGWSEGLESRCFQELMQLVQIVIAPPRLAEFSPTGPHLGDLSSVPGTECRCGDHKVHHGLAERRDVECDLPEACLQSLTDQILADPDHRNRTIMPAVEVEGARALLWSFVHSGQFPAMT
ncbi:MAG TPA: hypothetical protein VGX03_15360 [Candidatus Binatia bacterium]|nr:hypothetical protein [Candidatus Binatia bacterium]